MHTLFNFKNLRTKLSYLHGFFSFTFFCPDLHDTYKLIESCLIDSTDFENPLNYIFFCEFCHLLLNPTSFNLHLYFFLQVFFLLIFLTDMKCRWFSLKKKEWQDNGFFCICTLFCNVTFYWYKSLYYYILLYICKK